MAHKDANKPALDPDMMITDLLTYYPHIVDYLIEEYGFFCFNCILSGFETLRQGAETHKIVGEDFEEMMKRIKGLQS